MNALKHAQVSAFLDDIEASGLELHGLVILQHGRADAEGRQG